MTGRGMGRRAVLLGGAAGMAAAGGAGWLLAREDGPPLPDVEPGPFVEGRFRSARRGGEETGWVVSYPPGHRSGERLPVLVVLHGAAYDHTAVFSDLGLDRFLAAAVAEGVRPFTVAAADGGPTFWRAQPDGTDSGAMVATELLPLLEDRGLDVSRVALAGWSMGGYGALLLASRGTLPLACVGAMSPALSPGQPDRLDVHGHPERLAGLPVRVDCGRDDDLYPAVRDFARRLEPEEQSFGAGRHDMAYWRSVAPAQLRFAGRHLR